MIIEKATYIDLEKLYAITQSCGKYLIEKGIFQWNDFYPSKEILENDIHSQQIWKLVVETKIIGMVVLTEIVDNEYKNIKWLTENNNNLYLHRLAVEPKFQGKGYAQKLMDFAENFAVQNKYISIRLDTFSQNEHNQRFYKQRNYIQLESIYLPNQSEFPFYCFEKILNA